MTTRRRARSHACSTLSAFGLAFLLLRCDDDSPTSDNPTTTTTTAPASTASAFLRAAPLAFDARTVDVVVIGADRNDTLSAIPYPEVSDYLELGPGDYRVQFFPVGSRRAAIAESSVTLSSDEAVTAALVGLSTMEVTVIEDNQGATASAAGVTMTNAVPDFPAPLDAVIFNGPTLFEGVGYLETTEARELIPGVYDIQIRRGGTDEPVATSTGHQFAAGANYTIFAVGSLAHGDLAIEVATDTP